jgi:hypothetical protein
MKTITVGFSKSKKPLAIGSWLIRTYMKAPYSHVYLKFRSESLDRTLIYEAVGVGLRFIGEEVWKGHAEEVASFQLQVPDEAYVRLLQYCVDNAGREYGYLQNVGVPLAKLLGLKSNPFQEHQNCSETVLMEMKLLGYAVNVQKDLATPKDIYEALSKVK